jgi:hypothetical protein
MLSAQSKWMQPSHISTKLLKKIWILCCTYLVRTGIENQSTYLSLYDANITILKYFDAQSKQQSAPGGGAHSLAGKGAVEANSDEGTDILVL